MDSSGNVYIADHNSSAIKEIPNVLIGPASFLETLSAGSDSLEVLPATAQAGGIFGPTSDQAWLTIGTDANGVVDFSFSANTNTGVARVAHIGILGQQIPVTQPGPDTPQTITFTPVENQLFGAGPVTVAATASSQLTVSFSSLTGSVCTTSGSNGATVTLLAIGTCTIQANQGGNPSWAPAAPVDQSFQVQGPMLGTTSLYFGSAAGSSSVVLSAATAWAATSNSSFLHISPGSESGTGNALVLFTYDAFTGTGSRTGTLTVAGFTVTVTQAGTNYVLPGGPVTIVPTGTLYNDYGVAVSASGNVYIADTYHDQVLEWNAATQQITQLLSQNNGLVWPFDVAVDGSGNVYVANTGSGGLYEWNAATQQATVLLGGYPLGVAVDNNANVYFSAGNINEYYWPTQQVTTLVPSTDLSSPGRLAVDGFGSVYIADSGNNAIKEWNPATQQVTTVVSAGLNSPWGVAVDGSGNLYIADTGNGAIKVWNAATGQVTTLLSTGLNGAYSVAVDGAGNVYVADSGNNAIKEIPNVLVGPGSFNELIGGGSDSLQVFPATANLSGVFTPTSDSPWLTIGTAANGVVNFSFAQNTNVARVGHITVLGAVVPVNQPGLPAQTITFGPLANQAAGAAPITVIATASSGLPVSFSSLTPSVCSTSGSNGSTVTPFALGTCTIQANQGGNPSLAPAPPVNQSFQVELPQTITFAPLPKRLLGAAPFTVHATATSKLPVSFTSLTTAVCTTSGTRGDTVTLVAAGTCTIQATQAGNAKWAPAPAESQSFLVESPQTINFAPLPNQRLQLRTFTVTATASSGLPVAFASLTGSVCTVRGTTVRLRARGTCTLQASQTGDAYWEAAAPVDQSFQVE